MIPCICMHTIKNNHNYTVQIIPYFEKKLKLYMVLTYTFFKSYISKICNDLSLFIHNLEFDQFMGSSWKPLVLVSHIERIFPHFLSYKLWSERVVYHNQLMVHYSFASKLIRQKVREDFFDVGYQNQRLPRTFHKWVKSEVELEVNSTHTYICVYIYFRI